MAVVLKGKRKNQKVKIHQWCNDWIMTDKGLFNPSSLQYTHKEMLAILQHNNNGMLLDIFEPTFDLKFKRKAKRKCLS